MITEEQADRAITIAAEICIALNDIPGGYSRWLFLLEIKEQSGICWECGYPLGPTGYCYCTRDD